MVHMRIDTETLRVALETSKALTEAEVECLKEVEGPLLEEGVFPAQPLDPLAWGAALILGSDAPVPYLAVGVLALAYQVDPSSYAEITASVTTSVEGSQAETMEARDALLRAFRKYLRPLSALKVRQVMAAIP